MFGFVSKDPSKKYFKDEYLGKNEFNKKGLVGMATNGPDMNASQFFITLADKELKDLHKRHTLFGRVAEGLDVIDKINKAYCDPKN